LASIFTETNDAGVPGGANFGLFLCHHFVDIYLEVPGKHPILLSGNVHKLFLCDIPTTNTCILVVVGVQEGDTSAPSRRRQSEMQMPGTVYYWRLAAGFLAVAGSHMFSVTLLVTSASEIKKESCSKNI
tara:strand:+ start:987 stop:1373 length:387 start_codon:yes stop_codon:yes gene_type:complete